ncbi:MAG: glycosyltransferase family 39 protein [bacterium]|nr:glycosyltransferase family 39 protein [bacterium]
MTRPIISEPLTQRETDRTVWITMAVLFTLALSVRMACFTGLIASDDLGYAKYAQQIANGTYHLESHHYAIRYGVIVPLALVYRLFGMHEWTTVILPVISSSLAPALVAALAERLSGRGVAWIAGLFLATFPIEVRYASVLVPEPFLETLLVIGVLLFVLAERNTSIILGLTAGSVLGISYLTKEPGVFVAVALFMFALLKRNWRLALTVAFGIAFVVVAELIWYWSQSGDLLFRLHAMAVHNRSEMAIEANGNLSYRLLKAYPRMMLVPSTDFGIHSLLAVGLSGVAFFWQRSAKTLLLLSWAALPFLYLNFGTSSFRSYCALPTAPRYIGLVYAPLFVLAAIVLGRWAGTIKKRRVVAAVVAIVCILGVACAIRTRRIGYRTEHVKQLRRIAVVARQNRSQICQFVGPDGTAWQQVLAIIEPDRLGCTGQSVLQIVPDPHGLPMSAQR